ncbi:MULTISPECIES: PEP-CTERM sorting domain-containing protein [unclassified Janthinobacterium]|uniref:PEP-CTERM sorting domain-containing protein n=1 Tax=unclassified Janthinobacterium TaxID=2610881 RepID=UPI000347EE60|nr:MULTISPECIES: PEP-CTERM sorting domain-containing protein [unclassified Janthinobacterium]MEC5159685.1 hypothetical protein [Janthinobacterium sp. CG_S6]
MKPLCLVHTALVTLFLAGAAHAAPTGHVANGSFEDAGANMVDGSYCYLNVAGHECGAVPGWSGQFALIHSDSAPWGVPNSPYGALLAGLQNQSYLEQTLTLAAPGVYALSWADAGRGNYGGAETYQVSFNGVVLETVQVGFGAGWTGHALSFAAAAPGVLRFAGLNASGDATAFIDHIAVASAVPEPSSYSMLMLGLVLLLCTARGNDTEKFAPA